MTNLNITAANIQELQWRSGLGHTYEGLVFHPGTDDEFCLEDITNVKEEVIYDETIYDMASYSTGEMHFFTDVPITKDNLSVLKQTIICPDGVYEVENIYLPNGKPIDIDNQLLTDTSTYYRDDLTPKEDLEGKVAYPTENEDLFWTGTPIQEWTDHLTSVS